MLPSGLILRMGEERQPGHRDLQALVKINPRSTQAFQALGELYGGQKKDAEALEAFQNYAQLKPEDASALDNIGICQYRLKQLRTRHSIPSRPSWPKSPGIPWSVSLVRHL